MPHKGRLLFVVVLAVAGFFVAGVAPASQLAGVNRFLCYRVDPGTTWKPVTYALTTQFGTLKAGVAQLDVLCAPARVSKFVITNNIAHLAWHPIKTQGFKARNVLVTNQFQTAAPLTVVSPAQLCVPTGKLLAPTAAGPPLVKGLDNYVCYLVKPAQIPTRPISVADQFGQAGGSALNPLRLCAPAKINGSPLVNAATHLVCYGVKLGPTVTAKHVYINNRFGLAQGTVFFRQSLCVPSLKKLAG